MAYSYYLNEASNALQAEEQKAIQRRNTAYSDTADKRTEPYLAHFPDGTSQPGGLFVYRGQPAVIRWN